MNAAAEFAPEPAAETTWTRALARLTDLGLRMASVVTEMSEVEGRALAAAAQSLPAPGSTPDSLQAATIAGLALDGADQALARATPRVATLAQSFDRIARAVRRTVALARRLERGWPRPFDAPLDRHADDQRAMLLRQAARGARQAIRARAADAEAAERFFADLSARLDDPAFEHDVLERPVEDVVRLLCQAIGLPSADDPPAAPAPAVTLPPASRGPRLGDTPRDRRHDPG